MKTAIYVCSCIICAAITIYLSATVISAINDGQSLMRILHRSVGLAGWILITYSVVRKKYKWIQKLYKN